MSHKPHIAPAFCAICVDEKGPFVRRPLGKNNALVTVCVGCDEEKPRARNTTRGYVAPQTAMNSRDVNERARKAARDVDPLFGKTFNRFTFTAKRTPTYLLERIPAKDESGKARTQAEAYAMLRKNLPGVYEFNFLGYDADHWIWERPDPALTKQLRQSEPVGLADLERLTKVKR